MASVALTLDERSKLEKELPVTSTTFVFPWEVLKAPGTLEKSTELSEVQRFSLRVSQYFQKCEAENRRPLLTELSLALGLSGPTELRQLAMTNKALRREISRAMTFVAAHYERMVGEVPGQGPMFMLKNIPDFTNADTILARPTYSFRDETQVEVNITDDTEAKRRGRELTPREAYLRLIKNTEVIEGDCEVVADAPLSLSDKMDKLLDGSSTD